MTAMKENCETFRLLNKIREEQIKELLATVKLIAKPTSDESYKLAGCEESTVAFITGLSRKRRFTAIFRAMNLTEKEEEMKDQMFREFEDPYTHEVTEFPVLVHGKYYDFYSVTTHSKRDGDIYTIAETKYKFTNATIQPGFDRITQIEKKIAKFKKQRRKMGILPSPAELIDAIYNEDVASVQAYVNEFRESPDRFNLPPAGQEKFSNRDEVPLIFAALKGNTEIFNILMSVPGINVNITFETADKLICPLLAAAKRGHADIVKTLLSQPGIEVDPVDDPKCTTGFASGNTPVIAAARSNHIAVVTAFIEDGKASFERHNYKGKGIAYYAYRRNVDPISKKTTATDYLHQVVTVTGNRLGFFQQTDDKAQEAIAAVTNKP